MHLAVSVELMQVKPRELAREEEIPSSTVKVSKASTGSVTTRAVLDFGCTGKL